MDSSSSHGFVDGSSGPGSLLISRRSCHCRSLEQSKTTPQPQGSHPYRPQFQDALRVPDLQEGTRQNFTCCGVQLANLHALIGHLHQHLHILIVIPPAANNDPLRPLQMPLFQPIPHSPSGQEQSAYNQQQRQWREQHNLHPTQDAHDDVELHGGQLPMSTSHASLQSSGFYSPPDLPPSSLPSPCINISGTSSSSLADAYPGGFPYAEKQQSAVAQHNANPDDPSTSQPLPPFSTASRQCASAFEATTVISQSSNAEHAGQLPLSLPPSISPRPSISKAVYRRYAAGDSPNIDGDSTPAPMSSTGMRYDMEFETDGIQSTVHRTPTILFNDMVEPSTPGRIGVGSPVSAFNSPPALANPEPSDPVVALRSSSKLGRTAHGGGVSGGKSKACRLPGSKPFRCPRPDCVKTYKQLSGLNYHTTYGKCTTITSEVEEQAGRFECRVGDCPRRYKYKWGLLYHYETSGKHGQEGFAMLADGVHPCLQEELDRCAA
ncbi:hypothetical protein V5O48_004193 [Marasmius crinis-equi]|uniref:C2H2-type domain-containing protein n=1 Tax=Marasmius crinis-equi TaxID=585013 RepID=A0ABR3FRI8_9AGAR